MLALDLSSLLLPVSAFLLGETFPKMRDILGHICLTWALPLLRLVARGKLLLQFGLSGLCSTRLGNCVFAEKDKGVFRARNIGWIALARRISRA
jgi:hypothetical protein